MYEFVSLFTIVYIRKRENIILFVLKHRDRQILSGNLVDVLKQINIIENCFRFCVGLTFNDVFFYNKIIQGKIVNFRTNFKKNLNFRKK